MDVELKASTDACEPTYDRSRLLSYEIIYGESLTVDVREYLTADGRNPYREWLDTLNVTPRARIQARVLRFSTGNLGDHKSVGGGVWEARVMFGPGYRTYFGKDGAQLVLLLLGGDKSTQTADVARAQESWKVYQEDKRRGKTK